MQEQQRSAGADTAIRTGLIVLAVYNLGLAAFMTISPHAFFRAVGPFEDLNRHYIRDVATFSAALGFGFVVAIRRPSWRVPVLAITTVQFALHSVNHLFDADSAHPRWTGWFDFVALAASTVLLALMWRRAAEDDRAGAPGARRTAGTGGADASVPGPAAALPRTSVSASPRAERSTT